MSFINSDSFNSSNSKESRQKIFSSNAIKAKVSNRKIFNFDDSCRQVKELLKNKSSRNFNINIQVGCLLSDIRLNKPYFNDLKFWDYIDKVTGIYYHTAFEYIRDFEIIDLLKQNGFNVLPGFNTHIRELWNYTDNQIIEIWAEVLKSTSGKITADKIKKAKDTLRTGSKYLERIETVNTFASFHAFESDKYRSIRNDLVFNQVQQSHNKEYETLKDTYNNLVRDFKQLQNTISSQKSKILHLELELEIERMSKKTSSFSFNSHKPERSIYEILDIKPGVSENEVKKAFKEFSFEYHPDRVSAKGLTEKQAKVFEKIYIEGKNAYEKVFTKPLQSFK